MAYTKSRKAHKAIDEAMVAEERAAAAVNKSFDISDLRGEATLVEKDFECHADKRVEDLLIALHAIKVYAQAELTDYRQHIAYLASCAIDGHTP